ncbi:DEAD/DEAH box helicase [Bacteroides ihuae]|uniref:DEAD/DEAH box helicase n=1 Tax=Bacteroides ihuae TaxID=1852362 RepID=UPI0008D9F672|nr:DEAD/DEAH box helicase [Bacteroides ihuae]
MENIVNINYEQTGESSNTNALGMRQMQAMVYEARTQQYLLIKAPPASGKSRALMFVALDKLANQGIKRVIVAVPEKSIGRSFKETNLRKFGFFADWKVAPYFDLCDVDNEKDKSGRFKEFFQQKSTSILICTHATLRFAMKELMDDALNDTLLAIDEFHHASADETSGLGDIVRRAMTGSTAHIIAMTGSYFRGDGVPVLRPEDEERFYRVTYNYYQQLNGYRYLKSLGIGYHFYQGSYLSALAETDLLDTNKKTIIHIPSVKSRAATGDKYNEVQQIMSVIGDKVDTDYNTGVYTLKCRNDGRLIRVVDLVEDDLRDRNRVQGFLQRMKGKDAVDIIIALGTAKEGFDWEWCEHCLTIGVRGSLTEVVQIIGRCTRDCEGKEHAQFTNLIAAPEAIQEKVEIAVNDILKAITASLLMEQVMAPVWKFKTKEEAAASKGDKRTLIIEGLKPLSTEKTKHIVANDLDDLKATILQNDMIVKAMGGNTPPEVINNVLIPKIIQERHPDCNDDELEELRQHVVLDSVTKGGEVVIGSDGNRMLKIANRFINIDDLSIKLIDSINPFQRAYEIMSKSVTAPVLRLIQESIAEQRIQMTKEEAVALFRRAIPEYMNKHNGHEPEMSDPDPQVSRMAEAIAFVRNAKIQAMRQSMNK